MTGSDSHGGAVPQSGFRTTEFGDEQLKWRCQTPGCGHVTDQRDHGHEYSCRDKMVPVDPYTETPVRYEDLTLFERIVLEGTA